MCDHDDLGRKDEVGADGALHLLLLQRHQVDPLVEHGLQPCCALAGLRGLVAHKQVEQFFSSLETQVLATEHEQRRNQPGRHRADAQRRRHQNGLVAQRAFGHRPDHRQLAGGLHTGDLLGVQRQIVAQHPSALFRGQGGHGGHVVGGGHALAGRHLGHRGDIVEQRGDVVDQEQQAGGGHGDGPVTFRPRASASRMAHGATAHR
jgi:hypothetical protein